MDLEIACDNKLNTGMTFLVLEKWPNGLSRSCPSLRQDVGCDLT